jgi:tetratricopeptide (TPR) repeat protein
MSYIHEALKKAQTEKDRLLSGRGSPSTYLYGRGIFKRQWLVTTSLVFVSLAFSAHSWLHSLNRLTLPSQASVAVDKAPRTVPERPEPPQPPESGERQVTSEGPLRFPMPQAPPKPAKQASRPAKAGKRQVPQQTPPRKSALENASSLYSRALALHTEGRLQEAKRLYEDALKGSPDLVSALNNLGAIYVQEENYGAGRRVLEKAIQIEPQYVDPYYNLACLHAQQKDVNRSLSYLRRAVALDKSVRDWARADKDLQNLRGHSEYEKIIQGTKSP